MEREEKNFDLLKIKELLSGENIGEGILLMKEVCSNIEIGIILLGFKRKELLYSNAFFNSFLENRKKFILENIFGFIKSNIDNKEILEKEQEIEYIKGGEGFVFGFRVHKINNEIVSVFIKQVTFEAVYCESRSENKFYDKFSELVAETAHEIGNPLSGMSTTLSVLLHNIDKWPMEKIVKYIERTITEIDRLNEFLIRMREISREKKMELKQILLNAVIEKLYSWNEELIKKKKIIFKNMIKDTIKIMVDKDAFYQVILNLLRNSLNILNPGEEIKIYVEKFDDFFIRLIFRNNGKTIRKEELEKIFSPFFTTRKRGEGLGLALSLKLMTRMGGTIKAVLPEDGIGAKFVLYIPIKIIE